MFKSLNYVKLLHVLTGTHRNWSEVSRGGQQVRPGGGGVEAGRGLGGVNTPSGEMAAGQDKVLAQDLRWDCFPTATCIGWGWG